MSHTPHELTDEFPEHAEAIRRLKAEDTRFARLFDEYHEVNRAIHRAQTLVEPTDETHEHEMRKQRVALKDQLYGMLQAN